ncbi:MAG: nucleoside deaminase [Verrucomicrobia bacterium]|nr:nucleoside deaminase [Verrucomicrobiota bacterium]
MRDPFMQAAVDEAYQGLSEGGIPIGSVLVHEGKIIGRGHNMRMQSGNPLLHGEMSAFQDAGRQPASVYRGCVLYTTLSPCPMCSGTALLYKIPRIVIAENVTFLGAEDWLRHCGVELQVLKDQECIQLMQDFIAAHPVLWNEDIAE